VIPLAALHDERLLLISESYRRLTGKILTDPFDPGALWNAKRAIVAHGTESDPVFFYGNKLALELFEMRFEEFTRMPSRFSAEPVAQPVRAALLEKVTRQGFVDNYSGVRIAKSGSRFTITDGTVWNILDEAGKYHGQAATFVVQFRNARDRRDR
jgi:hypothetical protein